MTPRKWIIFGLSMAILVVCGLSVAIIIFTTRQLSAGATWLGGSLNLVSAQETEERRFASGETASLTVTSDGGVITVTAGDGDEIVVSMRRTGYGATEAEAEAALAGMTVDTTLVGNQLDVRYAQPRENSLIRPTTLNSVDFIITVPRETAVTLATAIGDVTLTGSSGDAEVRTSFGAIGVTDVTGALVADTSSGDVIASSIRAGAESIDLQSDFGSIVLRNSTASAVMVRSSSGSLTLSDVGATGVVTARTDFGEVRLTNVLAERSELRTSSGDVVVGGVAGPLTAHTDFGAITVTDAEDATLNLTSASGDIDFSGSLGPGPHTVNTDFGSVTLSLPEDVAVEVDLQTDFGEVESAFPVTTRGSSGGDRLQGAINGGGDLITASTNSGDVTLKVLEP